MSTNASAAAPAPRSDTSRALFYGDERGVRATRRWVAHHVAGWSRADEIEAVTTELASNAARHTASAGALFTVVLEWEDSGMAVVLRDRGSTRSEPHVSDPYNDEHDRGLEHGHGMVVINGLADEWGTAAGPHGRDTWAWFDGAAVRGNGQR